MKEVIYLAGQISVDKIETYQWRKDVCNYFEFNDQYDIINPCANPYNIELLYEYKDKNTNWNKIYANGHNNILVSKDKSYVNRASIVIANLIQYDKNKPIIGTLFELAWCNYINNKTVIGIHDNTKSIHYTHPFITNTISTWVTDQIHACNVIDHYFSFK